MCVSVLTRDVFLPQVHMYNIPSLPALTTTLADLRKAQELFPQGQGLAVIEPFFKLMLDGTYGIRVDNPAEVGDQQPGSRMQLIYRSQSSRHACGLLDSWISRPASAAAQEAITDTFSALRCMYMSAGACAGGVPGRRRAAAVQCCRHQCT
jgi:hypothetical protein